MYPVRNSSIHAVRLESCHYSLIGLMSHYLLTKLNTVPGYTEANMMLLVVALNYLQYCAR